MGFWRYAQIGDDAERRRFVPTPERGNEVKNKVLGLSERSSSVILARLSCSLIAMSFCVLVGNAVGQVDSGSHGWDLAVLTPAQLKQAEASRFSVFFVKLCAKTLWQGFDWRPSGLLDETAPTEYLGERSLDWVERNQSHYRHLRCEELSQRLAICSYRLLPGDFPSRLGDILVDGEVIDVVVRFQDSIATQVTAEYPKWLLLEGDRNTAALVDPFKSKILCLDLNTQDLMTLLYGSPKDSSSLTKRFKIWKTFGFGCNATS